MELKFCCAWLYAISKYNKYGDTFQIHHILNALEKIKQIGFETTEIEAMGRNNLEDEWNARKRIKEKLSSLELTTNNLCAVFPELMESNWKKHIPLFEKSADLANYLNCETIQLDSHMPPVEYVSERPYDETIKFDVDVKIRIEQGPNTFNWNSHWESMVNSIKACDEIAQDRGLRLCLEPRVHESISNTDAILRLFDWVNSENFGAVLDTGHLHAQKEIIPLSVEKLGEKIFFVHASDNDGRTNAHLGVGRGNIDWEGTLKALKKHHFNDYIAIDIGNLPKPYDLDQEITHSIKYLEKINTNLFS
jgi:sugar phosphate isomerase/epimerase